MNILGSQSKKHTHTQDPQVGPSNLTKQELNMRNSKIRLRGQLTLKRTLDVRVWLRDHLASCAAD